MCCVCRLGALKPGALRRKAIEVGCDSVKLAEALGGRRLVDGCGTVEPVSAVSTVHYLRMAEVAEVGLDQPRDLCLLLTLRRDDESGNYSIAMRCVFKKQQPDFSRALTQFYRDLPFFWAGWVHFVGASHTRSARRRLLRQVRFGSTPLRTAVCCASLLCC